jgi:hypothetical protein
MKRLVLAALFGTVVYAIALASAATLDVGASSLGSGSNLASSCDTNGVTVSYGTTYTSGGYTVNSVTIDGIDAACAGRGVGATLTNTGDAAQGAVTSGTVPTGGTGDRSATLTVTGDPAANAVEKAYVVIG